MPTYEYVCSKCDQQFDVFQSISEKPLTVCPEDKCRMSKWGKGKVKRAISAGAGLLFKGSGFHITDYRSASYREAAKKESSSASPSPSRDGKPSVSKTEAKSATTPTTKPAAPKSKGE